MSIDLIQERLNTYNCQSVQEEEHALREITQEIILSALARTGFFDEAAFHGGTCLRILYTLNRFSEDLDFMLKTPNPDFSIEPYLKNISLELKAFGYELEIADKSKAQSPVKKAFLKDNSLGKVLSLNHLTAHHLLKKIKIKLELDINPPLGSEFESKYLNFPFASSITVQNLPSLFSGKIHALLCRNYHKGRDWFDFLWYLSRNIDINFKFLQSALYQTGPWTKKDIDVNINWCKNKLKEKISTLNWDMLKKEIINFVKPIERPSIKLWSQNFFINNLETYYNKKISKK